MQKRHIFSVGIIFSVYWYQRFKSPLINAERRIGCYSGLCGTAAPELSGRRFCVNNRIRTTAYRGLPYKRRKRGTMIQSTSNTITRRIGSTTYKVKEFFKEDGNETMEDKIFQLIRREVLESPTECGMIDMPQMNRQSERSA